MKPFALVLLLAFIACNTKLKQTPIQNNKQHFNKQLTLAFGSCNNQRKKNTLYSAILEQHPKAWIWGGDIIYSDTDNPKILNANFEKLKHDSTYTDFRNKTKIIATWDDHDYGVNDGGIENPLKIAAQKIFLDFLDVPADDIRRQHEGVYYSTTLEKGNQTVKILVLDTRYFRTALKKDPTGKKRYLPTSTGTMLGTAQWQWLESELNTSKASFNVIVSSIQFLSNKHGFESWGNMPNEVERLKNIIVQSQAKNVMILSGDRHIAEISKDTLSNNKPLLDITSSGLTHAYTAFHGEENPFRVSKVVAQKNFGMLYFNFDKNQVLIEIRGEENTLLVQYLQKF